MPRQNSIRSDKQGTLFKMYGKQKTHSFAVQKIKAATQNRLSKAWEKKLERVWEISAFESAHIY